MDPTEFRIILAATDFSDCSRRALEYAAFLATKFDARLVLMHAYELPAGLSAATMVPTGGEIQMPLRDYLRNAAETQLRETVAALAARGVSAEFRVEEGRAHVAVVEVAEAVGADLLVVGTHGRTGLSHLLLGSTAERVLRHAPCPVFVVREASAPGDVAPDVEP